MIRRRLNAILLAFALLAGATSSPAHAQLSQVDPFLFGEWVVISNAGTRTIIVNTNGSYSHSPELFMMSPPQPGLYRLEGLVPFSNISSVNVNMVQPLTGPGSETFAMDSFTVDTTAADGDGIAFITIGARALTTASGIGYDPGVYNGVIDLIINL